MIDANIRESIGSQKSVIVSTYSSILRGTITAITQLKCYSFLELVARQLRGRFLRQGVLVIQVFMLEETGDHVQCAKLHEEKSCQHRPSAKGIPSVVKVFLLAVVILLFSRGLLGVIIMLATERTGQLKITVALPVKSIEESMCFDVVDITKAQSFLWIKPQEIVHQISQLRSDADWTELSLLEASEIRTVSGDHMENEHSKRPEVSCPCHRLSLKFFRRNKRRCKNNRRWLSFGVQIGKIGGQGVPIFPNDNIIVIDASVDDSQVVQLFECQDHSCDNKPDMYFQIRAKEVIEKRVVGEYTEVFEVCEVEVEAEVGVIFIEMEVSDNEVGTVE